MEINLSNSESEEKNIEFEIEEPKPKKKYVKKKSEDDKRRLLTPEKEQHLDRMRTVRNYNQKKKLFTELDNIKADIRREILEELAKEKEQKEKLKEKIYKKMKKSKVIPVSSSDSEVEEPKEIPISHLVNKYSVID